MHTYLDSGLYRSYSIKRPLSSSHGSNFLVYYPRLNVNLYSDTIESHVDHMMGQGVMSDGDDDRKPMLQHLYHPDQMHHMKVHHHVMQDDHHQDCGIPLPPTKPKIWSLADTAASKTPPPGQQWPNVSPSLASPGFTMPNSSLSPSGSSYSR